MIQCVSLFRHGYVEKRDVPLQAQKKIMRQQELIVQKTEFNPINFCCGYPHEIYLTPSHSTFKTQTNRQSDDEINIRKEKTIEES